MMVKLGAARAMVDQGPQAADALLASLEEDLERTMVEIRRLVYGLRPPALDDLGLVGAVRERVLEYHPRPGAKDGVQIVVDAVDSLPALPAAVEVAAYRIVDEALANVVRHASARCCIVRFAMDGTDVLVEISDDGIGLVPRHRAGVGLSSMRERAAELGGTCVVTAGWEGGTRVVARLPLREEPADEKGSLRPTQPVAAEEMQRE